MELNAGFWFFLGALIATFGGLTWYTFRSNREEGRHTCELAQLIAQSTDRHIAEGNQRVERFLKEISLRQLQIFERVDRPKES